MIVHFEITNNRVKGLCFHPKRKWILVSLHSGKIELYDYLVGCLIDSYDEHCGPVRGIDFHPIQSLFVSGGDDYKIKVWDFCKRKCLFDLLGHSDYVRTTKFHREYPWILSASDDQTARIWNWQSRQCISVLSGHNHYIMCAQFHPSSDLILTASLDETIRLWDISALKSANTSQTSKLAFFDSSKDLFNTNGVILKTSLEGHTRGINWASFHPTKPLIVSAADDREIKVWMYSENLAWEKNSSRSHSNNVSCAIFDPKKDSVVLSASEDKSLHLWDFNSGTNSVFVKRDNDRFWQLTAHPTNGCLAAGHDQGFLVFRIHPEFPITEILNEEILVYQNSAIHCFNLQKETTKVLLKTSLSSSDMILLNAFFDELSIYAIHKRKSKDCNDANVTIYQDDTQLFKENSVVDFVFYSAESFACLKYKKDGMLKLFVEDYQGRILKSKDLKDLKIKKMFRLSNDFFLTDSEHIYRIDHRFNIKKIAVSAVQSAGSITSVIPNRDQTILASLSKFDIVFYDEDFKQIGHFCEHYEIKGGIWDSAENVFLYTTSFQFKYVLTNGESGIITSLKTPLKLLKMEKTGKLFGIDGNGKLRLMELDRADYMFKISVLRNEKKKADEFMSENQFIGKHAVDFLLRNNCADLALKFSSDPETKFELALECGDMKTAQNCADKLDSKPRWKKLAQKAIELGFFLEAEKALIKAKDFDRLAFLYFISGQKKNLEKLLQFALKLGDINRVLRYSLFLGDSRGLLHVFEKKKLNTLGWVTAMRAGASKAAEKFKQSVKDEKIIERCNELFASTTSKTSERLYSTRTFDEGFIDWPRRDVESTNREEEEVG